MVLYWEIPFETIQGISIPRLSWVQCVSGGIQRGAVLGFDCHTKFNCISLFH
jgi:hypothetical protein